MQCFEINRITVFSNYKHIANTQIYMHINEKTYMSLYGAMELE